MPETELVNIKIDGKDLQVPKGEKIIESAKRIGVEVPFFCYHPRLSMEDGGANCRMCLVEVAAKGPDGSVRKMPKPQTACSLPASEGMEITTESPSLVKDRQGVLEFLLINHPLDCPICDRGGECPLQNNTLYYGPPTTRYIEEKRHFPKAYPLSDYVVFDRERCIHCARCTRFTTDISGDAQLNFLWRGADMEVGTFEHTSFHSKFSGNVIELCPVGALLSRTYRFAARPWDLLTQRSICTQCSNGCNVKLDYRVNSLQRVNARCNEAVNEEWTCDKGKFGMEYVSSDDRLVQPMVKRAGIFEPITWEDANRLIVEKLREAGPAVGGIGGARSSNEDLFVWQRFFRDTLKCHNLDHRMGPNFPETSGGLFKRFGYHTMGNTIADMERIRTIFVLGSDLVDEQPILFLRVRKAWRFRGASIIAANPPELDGDESPNRLGEFASLSLRYRPGTEVALLHSLTHVMFMEDLLPRERLATIPNLEAAKSGMGVERWRPEQGEQETGVPADSIRRAARLLASGEAAFIAGKTVTDHPRGADVIAALGNLAVITGSAGNVNIPVTENNQQGAMDMGILPDSLPGYVPAPERGMNTQEMLEAAARGELNALWIVGADLVNDFYDPDLAQRAIEACPFVVVNALSMTDTAKLADLVLPVQSVAERDGTYTNVERRVQRFYRAFEISASIRPEWLIFAEVGAKMGGSPPYFAVRDVMRDIAAAVPMYKDISLRTLGDQGIRWEYPGTPPAPTMEPVPYRAATAAGV